MCPYPILSFVPSSCSDLFPSAKSTIANFQTLTSHRSLITYLIVLIFLSATTCKLVKGFFPSFIPFNSSVAHTRRCAHAKNDIDIPQGFLLSFLFKTSTFSIDNLIISIPLISIFMLISLKCISHLPTSLLSSHFQMHGMYFKLGVLQAP